MSAKTKSVLIKLSSSANTGFYYVTSKNPTRTPQKLTLRKYDPIVRQHVLFHEAKLPSGKKK